MPSPWPRRPGALTSLSGVCYTVGKVIVARVERARKELYADGHSTNGSRPPAARCGGRPPCRSGFGSTGVRAEGTGRTEGRQAWFRSGSHRRAGQGGGQRGVSGRRGGRAETAPRPCVTLDRLRRSAETSSGHTGMKLMLRRAASPSRHFFAPFLHPSCSCPSALPERVSVKRSDFVRIAWTGVVSFSS